jgi:RNA polymerase sigma-54 factor
MPQGLYLSQKMALAQVLAPQLQQSLALLQAPTLELQALVQQEMEQNPVLEEESNVEVEEGKAPSDNEGDAQPPSAAADPAEPPADVQFDPATEKESKDPVDDFQAEFERLTQLDQEWRDHFAATNAPLRSSEEDEEKREFMFNSIVQGTSLQESLLAQVRLSELNNGEISVAELIIGNVDDYGYLKSSIDELVMTTNVDPDRMRECSTTTFKS